MEKLSSKIIRNLRNGTILRNGIPALKNRISTFFRNANILYRFDAARVATKAYMQEIPGINSHIIPAGNYFLDSRWPLGPESVVYSFGILTDISFDRYVVETYGSPVYMYDPTPAAINFMKQYEGNDLLRFFPIGVWTENTTLTFSFPETGGSASVLNASGSNRFEAKCLTMQTILDQNGHDHIDVFKADIEGAALPVLEQMLEQDIFPAQIVVEFERPRRDPEAIQDFFRRVTQVRDTLREKGYQEYLLPRKTAKYFSLELLFVNLAS